MLSMNDRWLLATISGPVGGMFSRPSMTGRQSVRNSAMTTNRDSA